jgi:uncharacterized membrane protein YhhN
MTAPVIASRQQFARLAAPDRAVLVVFTILLVLHWVLLAIPGPSFDPPVMATLKAAPMVLAAGWIWWRLEWRFGIPLAIGFLGAAVGDAFLALDRHVFLAHALSAFLVTQLAYAAAFVALPATTSARLAAWLPVVLGLLALALMWSGLGAFRWPVAVYVAALVAMVALAARVGGKPGLAFIGAMAFLLADLLIGVNRFVAPFSGSAPIIVAIYSIGQGLLFVAMLRSLPRRAVRPHVRGG